MGQKNSSLSDSTSRLQKVYDEEFEKLLALHDLKETQRKSFELAERRVRALWEIMGGVTTCIALMAASSFYRRREIALPIIPIILAAGYRYDLAFGDSQASIQERAFKIYREEPQCLKSFVGPITLPELDAFVRRNLK